MTAIQYMKERGHEQLLGFQDQATGLTGFIALHNTKLGPGLGGTRLWHYESVEDAAMDALRLSEAMTYKAAAAGLNSGGGKAVIMADGNENDAVIRKARMQAFGKFINQLDGRYITTEDVGTTPNDMMNIRSNSTYVVGTPLHEGGSGDPSPMTAIGLMAGYKAIANHIFQQNNLKGLRVAVQGLGKVGMSLVAKLVDEGATVVGSDVSSDKCEEAITNYGIEIMHPNKILKVDCDIFAPCALGPVLDDNTIPELKCKVVAGCANVQLLDEQKHGEALHNRGIHYIVDYIINAGGLINVYDELSGYSESRAKKRAEAIQDTVSQLLKTSMQSRISTVKAARMIADTRLKQNLNA